MLQILGNIKNIIRNESLDHTLAVYGYSHWDMTNTLGWELCDSSIYPHINNYSNYLKMRLLFILVIIPSSLSYMYFSPTADINKKISAWNTKAPNGARQEPMKQMSDERYNMVFPQLENSVIDNNYGYEQIFKCKQAETV